MDELKSLITDLDRLLWEFPLTDHPEVLAILERIQRYLLSLYADAPANSRENLSLLTQVEAQVRVCLQTLGEEISQLQQQRQFLMAEIKQLEELRQQTVSDSIEPTKKLSQASLEPCSTEIALSWRKILAPIEEDLQKNAESLSEGLKRMYDLGQQGEARFLAYFNRLQQYLTTIPPLPTSTSTAIALGLATLAEEPSGSILVLEFTEKAVELVWIDPQQNQADLEKISPQVIYVNYGTRELRQDILIYLIYPQWKSQISSSFPPLLEPFPRAGFGDHHLREILAQQLQNHPLEKAFLEAAQLSQQILQHQLAFTSSLFNQPWGITRQEFLEKIINPYWQQLRQQIENLLADSLTLPAKILLTGPEIATISYALESLLKTQFPQAAIVLIENTGQELST